MMTQIHRRLILSPSALALLLLLHGSRLPAQTNWPSFRGLDATGLAGGSAATPASWNTKSSENIAWKTPIPGLGHSSPIIWSDRLFITTAVNQRGTAELKVGLYGDPQSAEDNDIHEWKVFCLNKQTGAILWQATAHQGKPQVKRHPKATHANCTMATDGSIVIAFFGSEGLYCYDLDGHLRWQKSFGKLLANPIVYNDTPAPDMADLEWGFASSPIIHGNLVFLQCDVLTNGFLAALNLADGREVWRTPRDDTGTWSTPNVCATESRPQVVVNGWKHMGGYDAQTGKELWRMSGGGDCPVPTPVAWHDLIFLMSAHGPRSPIYAVRTNATGDVSLHGGASTNQYIAWSILRGASYMETPIIYGNLLYSCQSDGVLTCFDAATGKQMYKERMGPGGDGFTASPVASEGKIYFTSEHGAVYVVKPGPVFNILATNQMDEVCMATPAISDGTIYFRTQGHVVAVGGKK
jgi:outer membrane protein assembly factor BamB